MPIEQSEFKSHGFGACSRSSWLRWRRRSVQPIRDQEGEVRYWERYATIKCQEWYEYLPARRDHKLATRLRRYYGIDRSSDEQRRETPTSQHHVDAWCAYIFERNGLDGMHDLDAEA